MKKNILITFSLIIIGLFGCLNQVESSSIAGKEFNNVIELDVREVVCSKLTAEDKDRIKGTWQDSKLNKITLNESMGIINDKAYIGKEVNLIDIPTKSISQPNNMIVYASLDGNKIIGYGYVD